LVLPAELLHVNYAAPIRRFLLTRFAHVTLVTFERLVFPDVQAEVVLLLAEGQGPSEFIHVAPIRDLSDLGKLGPALGVTRDWRPGEPGGMWVEALLPVNVVEAYMRAAGGTSIEHVDDWGTLSLGAVTGNNGYFTMTQDQVSERGLTASDVLRISPPGSRHFRSLSFSLSELSAQSAAGAATYLFRPQVPSTAALKYIDAGERAGVDQGYKCRNRKPWWSVPLPQKPDIFVTYMSHDMPRFVANTADAQCLNSLHGLVLNRGRKGIGRELFPMAMLNSFTALGAELGGRFYGGGVLKLEPREAAALPALAQGVLEEIAPTLREIRPAVLDLLAKGRLRAVVELVDPIVLGNGLGLKPPEVEAIQSARVALAQRRQGRSQRIAADE
jgi:adenine-specific DNA-methyltransferase